MTHLSYNNNITRLLVLKDKKHQPWLLYAQVTPTSSDTTNTSYTDRDRIMKTRGGRKEVKGGGGLGIQNGAGIAKYRGARTRARNWQGVEAHWTFTFRENPPNTDTKTVRCQYSEENSGRKSQVHRDAEGPATGLPPRGRQRPGCRLRAAKGRTNQHGNRIIRRHAEWGEETSNGGWQAAGAGDVDVQVGGSLHR